MTNISISKDPYVIELVVYRVKSAFKNGFHDLLEEARRHIKKLPGMVEYDTFKSTSNELIFIDLVKWESLEQATEAAKKVEKMKSLAPFMSTFEEIKFMDHFEPYTCFNQHEKVNLIKLMPDYYKANAQPALLDLKATNYLMISGISAPEDNKFLKSIEAIYAVAYGVKFHYKTVKNDFVVPKMEAQWWSEGPVSFAETPRQEWCWNIMIPMPEFVQEKIVNECIQEAIKKKGINELSEVEFKSFEEGKSVQILHIGSYEKEESNIKKIMAFATNNELTIDGHHHEIYLSDPMKTPEDKLKTIIRYPVR